MESNNSIEIMKKIQQEVLNYLDDYDSIEEKYQTVDFLLNESKIHKDQYDLKIFLYFLVKISKHHHRSPSFFDKIEKIILKYKENIMKYFTNLEIFQIFRSNKRILLFLVNEKIMIIDKSIFLTFKQTKLKSFQYAEYFAPEIKSFIISLKNLEMLKNVEDNEFCQSILEVYKYDMDEFNEKRKIGENDDYLNIIIRKDDIEKFIIYMKKEDYDLNSKIKPSFYETNPFLLKNEKTTLIQYAAFFGSIQIFKYLFKNGAELDSILWIYAIHGDDSEIIHLLEENNIKQPDNSYELIMKESLKCHHNHIINYIENNLSNEKLENCDFYIEYILKYYNFSFFPLEFNNIDFFYYACKYDYFHIVEYFLNNKKIDVNLSINGKNKIFIILFLWHTNTLRSFKK